MCMLAASCVLQSNTFDVIIDAEEDSECYVISGPAFVSVSEANPKIKIFSLETAISRFSDVMWVMQQILFMSMDQRLAIFLTDESKRLGSDTIPFTHEQIAKYMGSAREVVTRMLKYFASEGLVEVSRGGVKILDKKRLWELAVEARDMEKPGGLRAGWFFRQPARAVFAWRIRMLYFLCRLRSALLQMRAVALPGFCASHASQSALTHCGCDLAASLSQLPTLSCT